MDIVLTNDDGIESPGLAALYDALSDFGDVTAVAPAEDMSATGRALSREVVVDDHEYGYAVRGTPSDCVIAALESLVPNADVVVSGCNRGGNLGAYVLGRSGTVSAAVEAAFFDVPAIAVSLALTSADFDAGVTPKADYAEAAAATAYLVEHTHDSGVFERADYLNVNAPRPGTETGGLAVTTPTRGYDMSVDRDGERLRLHDEMWDRIDEGIVAGEPADSDLRAVVAGETSVSPLTAPHTTEHHEVLDALAETY
ncbi:5-nucleotidase SurE [Halarchaeum acidiphilum MH1-52-1]|uniref:5'-nucleotidase SurE n=1 Tax=Halarchaeum acidiphilum MH1-52-1 TaxID=1261545 RepID=U2YCV7_9EURY|nr:5'/3'-nucleotidase SurE [Halarchaeum acidiphilum]GAD51461.1 5-nucleotidase SurE [Halarchaeum acidiphilum MH1-52-1]